MSDIPAELSLDVTSALAAVDRVEAALVAAVDAFQQSLNVALGGGAVPVAVDTSSITADIDSAVAAADVTVPVSPDVSDIAPMLSAAFADNPQTVPVEADTSAAQASISTLDESKVTVPVDADISGALEQIQAITPGIDPAFLDEIGQAAQQTRNLGGSLEETGNSARSSATALSSAATGTRSLAQIAGLASQNLDGLAGGLAGIGSQALNAAGGIESLVASGQRVGQQFAATTGEASVMGSALSTAFTGGAIIAGGIALVTVAKDLAGALGDSRSQLEIMVGLANTLSVQGLVNQFEQLVAVQPFSGLEGQARAFQAFIDSQGVGAASRLLDALQSQGVATATLRSELDAEVVSQRDSAAAKRENAAATKLLLGPTIDLASAAAAVGAAFGALPGIVGAGIAGVGTAVASASAGLQTTTQARDALVDKFQSGLPQIGDAFAVEAARVGSSVKSIDKSSQDLITAAKTLEDRFSAGLPSVGDAFKEGVSPEDLAKAKETLEAFIQGVEGVGKSAADAAQAVIDKATAEGGTGLAGFLQQLREQSAQIASFQASIATLRNRGALDLAGAFADRGIQSAADAAEAAGLSQADLAAAEATVEQAKGVKADAVQNLGLFADELVATFGPKGAEAGATFGEGLVANLASPDVIAKAKAEAAKIAEAAATPSGGGAQAPQEQSLAGFLAALKSQSGDVKTFQANLDKIASEGGTVLADTLREQGISAATAAAQAAALAPTALLAAEQDVRDAQTVLDQAKRDSQAAADDLVRFNAVTAQRAADGFNDNFVINVGPILGTVGTQILEQSNTIAGQAAIGGLAVGAAFGAAFSTGAKDAILASEVGAFLGATLGASAFSGGVQLPQLTLPPPPSVQTTAAPATAGPAVNVENINVTPPRDATVDEQAGAIAEQLAYAVNGFR